jgi:hypothetical protein
MATEVILRKLHAIEEAPCFRNDKRRSVRIPITRATSPCMGAKFWV